MKILFDHHSTGPGNGTAWCVFSHFDPNCHVEPYVLQYLSELKRCGLAVVLVSTSASLDEASVRAVEMVATAAILRENIGYDFGSYKVGIDHLRNRGILPRQLLLTNDSVFGPLYPLDKVLINAQAHDLYGMTDSFDFHHHLQSFFLVYGERVLQSQHFTDFWNRVEFINPGEPGFKHQIILRYEVGGSQYFLERGYSVGAAFPFTDVLMRACREYLDHLYAAQLQPGSTVQPLDIKFNATHRFWHTLLDMGFPFLKRELLLVNPTNADITTWPNEVRSRSNYDLTAVISAMRNYSGNDDFFFVTRPATIAELLAADGTVTLPINPAFGPWQAQFQVPDTRRFRFDENVYLEKCPDVRVAFMNGEIVSALHHFRNNGFKEGRASALFHIPD